MGLSSYCILNIPYSYNIGEEEFVLMTAAAAAFSFLVVFATTAITTIATAVSATSTTAVVLFHLLEEVFYFLFACLAILEDMTMENKVLACKRVVEVDSNLIVIYIQDRT